MDELMVDATEEWNSNEQNETSETHESRTVTKYRRRDLRNTLASHLGMIEADTGNSLAMKSRKRVRIEGLALDVSDFTLEDMINEFDKPTYIKFYDTKDSRVCIFEFAEVSKMEQFVQKYNGFELNGRNIRAEIFEQQKHRQRRQKSEFAVRKLGYRGSMAHKRLGPSPSGWSGPTRGRPAWKPRTSRSRPKSIEELDAELEQYMKRE